MYKRKRRFFFLRTEDINTELLKDFAGKMVAVIFRYLCLANPYDEL